MKLKIHVQVPTYINIYYDIKKKLKWVKKINKKKNNVKTKKNFITKMHSINQVFYYKKKII